MKIIKDDLQIEISENGQISKIKYKNNNILHDGKKHWGKIFPVIWPNLSFSNGFIVDDKNYELPKHGFWSDLKWEWIKNESELILLSTFKKNKKFPFSIDFKISINIISGGFIEIDYTLTNIGEDNAYFHFGLHPAFKINENSYLKMETNILAYEIDLDGTLTNKYINASKQNIYDMQFGKYFDTLVYKDVDFSKLWLVNGDLNIQIFFDSKNLQIWKPENANFVCIEPWYGWNDNEYDAPLEAKMKKEIISLKPTENFKSIFKLKISESK